VTSVKSQAIVLHLTRVGDSAIVIHTIDSVAGRQSLMLRGMGKKNRNIAALHNLSVLDVVTTEPPVGSMLYLSEFEPLFSLNGLRSDIYKSTMAMFIAEILYRSVREGDGGGEYFSRLVENIVHLDAVEGPAANFHLWWMADYCRLMGVEITSEGLAEMGEAPLGERCDGAAMLHFAKATLPEALAIPLSASRRSTLSSKMLSYLCHHLGVNLDIRSLEVLHEVFK